MTRKQILDAADHCVNGERDEQYGTPESSFDEIARLWTAYLGYHFTPVDVAVMMVLLKIARIKTGHGKMDNWVDLAGYAACGGEIEANYVGSD